MKKEISEKELPLENKTDVGKVQTEFEMKNQDMCDVVAFK